MSHWVIGSQVLQSKVLRHFVALQGFFVRVHEFLFDCQVVVCDGQDRDPILELLCHHIALL